MAAAPSQPISIGRMPSSHAASQSNLSINYQRNNNSNVNMNANMVGGSGGTSPAYSYLGASLAAQNPRWAGSSASPARSTQELSTSWNIHPGPLFVSSPHMPPNAHAGPSNPSNAASYSNHGPGTGSGTAGSSFSGGTPMSLSSSFQARFLPNSSSSLTGGVLNPLDPTEFKFSSSPYGRMWNGNHGSYTNRGGFSSSYGRGGYGGGFSGSVESDRMSQIEGYYGGRGEKEACRDFSCCGLRLHDLHALVEHYESVHAHPYDMSHPYTGPSIEHLRGRRVSSGNRRLVNQSSSSSLAGALGDEPSQTRSSASSHYNSSSMPPSASASTSTSPVRMQRTRDNDEGGTNVDDMEIGLDLDMDMDVDGEDSHPHSQPSSQHGSGGGSPNTYNLSPAGIANSVIASRATSPPDTPLLSTPVSPSAAHSHSGSGFNTPGHLGAGAGDVNAFQGFVLPNSAVSTGHGHGNGPGATGAWGENAVTPMPMMEAKRSNGNGGTYFGQQQLQQQRPDEDGLSNAGTSDGSASPAPPSSAASITGWDGTSQVNGHQGPTHTQSLYDLRAAAQAQAGFGNGSTDQVMSGNGTSGVYPSSNADYAAQGNNTGMNGASETYNGLGVGGMGMGGNGASSLAGGAAAQRAREREEALLRQGSGVLNGYAAYADWSRGFPGVSEAEASAAAPMGGAGALDSAAMAAQNAENKYVGPTESGVHPGLLFGNVNGNASSNSDGPAAKTKESVKEKNTVKLKLNPSAVKNASVASSPSTPLIGKAVPSGALKEESQPCTPNIASDPSLDDLSPGGNGSGSSLLLNKPYKCPTPGCTKSYKQANGLKYHVTHGQCSFTPPPELSSLTALSALTGSSLSPTTSSPIIINGKDTGSSLSATTLDKLKASLSLTQSTAPNVPLTLHTAEETLARLSAEERREVEREAERHLRPFCCAVPPCQRRYKNMNGLRYHYAHSGEHGRIGMKLLSQGKGANPTTGSGTKEGAPPVAAAGARPNSQGREAEKKKIPTSAPVTPRGGAFPHFQQQQSQAQATQMPLPPFPFPFALPNGLNMANMYASFQLPTPAQFAQAQSHFQNASVSANVNANANASGLTNTANTNGGFVSDGPRRGLISTQNSGPGMVLSQPASAYASPWSSRAPSPTRSSSQSPPTQTLTQTQAQQRSSQLTSPIEAPPQSAYPHDDEEGEDEDEFGYPEEIEEEMLEMEMGAKAGEVSAAESR